MARSDAALMRGARLGRYEVDSFLGAGGMGQVYVARDATLGRRVALKVLPPDCSRDRVARFIREAQASSALAHPAIVSLHDAGEVDGTHYLAMELIDGEPLSAWMQKHHSRGKAVELMAQVADGLAAAHAAGIVHRDLKPDNIMVSRDGYAKVVDFGIAKLKEKDVDGDGATEMKTASGSIVGTARYMSPEQIDGRAVDHRSDVFSFGTVLFELLTGAHPFGGTTTVEVMHNITHSDPPLDRVPAAYRRIVRRCLARDPNDRFDSMKDIAHELRDAERDGASAAPAARRWFWVPVAIALAAAALGIWRWRAARDTQQVRAAVSMTRLTNSGNVTAATISPDGKFAVYSMVEGDQTALWLKQLSTGTVTRITPPTRDFPQKILVSPDSNYIYYLANSGSNRNVFNIFQLPMLGGEPRLVAKDTEFTFAISPDGKQLVFRRYSAQTRINAITVLDIESGGERVIIKRVNPSTISNFAWSPDGSRLTMVAGFTATARRWLEDYAFSDGTIERDWPPFPATLGVASIAWLADGSGIIAPLFETELPPQVWFIPRSGPARKITSDLSAYYSAAPTADGNSFVALRGEGQPMLSLLGAAPDGTASIVASGLGYDVASGMQPSSAFGGNFSISRTVRWLDEDRLVYTGVDHGRTTSLVVSVRGGEPRVLVRGMSAFGPVVLPDKTRFAFVSNQSGMLDLWTARMDGSDARQLTKGAGVVSLDVSPDGRYIYYSTQGKSQFIYRISPDGGVPQQITDVPTGAPHISPDGRTILCRRREVGPDGQPQFRTTLISAEDGKVIRYYTLPLSGGINLQWHPSGKAFLAPDSRGGIGNLWQQDLATGELKQVTNFTRPNAIYSYAWSPDGKSIAMLHGEPRNDAVLIRDFR